MFSKRKIFKIVIVLVSFHRQFQIFFYDKKYVTMLNLMIENGSGTFALVLYLLYHALTYMLCCLIFGIN